MIRRSIPHVIFATDNPTRLTPSVSMDSEACGRLAAEHLIARGYRTFAFIGTKPYELSPWWPPRKAGFVRTLAEHGYGALQHEVLAKDWSTYDDRCRQAIARILATLPMPCGVFAATDVLASCIVKTARFQCIAIPEQLGIVGVDNYPMESFPFGAEKISSVQPPSVEIGRVAAATLHALMHGKKVAPVQMIPPARVIVRVSTDTFMIDDPLVAKAQRYIEERRNQHVRVPEVAKAIGTNCSTLLKHFGHALGIVPADYILHRRIECAKECLRAGALNVDQVAEVCAFPNTIYFRKVFKKLTGASPGQFRSSGKFKPLV